MRGGVFAHAAYLLLSAVLAAATVLGADTLAPGKRVPADDSAAASGAQYERGATDTPARPRRTLECPFSRDGTRPEKAPAATMDNGDNTVELSAWWSRDSLFFSIRVLDRDRVPGHDAGGEGHEGDVVEVLLDPGTRGDPSVESTRYRMALGPGGGRAFVLLASGPDSFAFDMPKAVSTHGWGYGVGFGVAWARLGVEPGKGSRLGCEFVNVDRDSSSGTPSYATWSGLSSADYRNPSAWGALVLTRRGSVSPLLVVLIAVVAMTLGVLLSRFLRKREEKRIVHRLRRAAETDGSGSGDERGAAKDC